jgi:hypothetical protein
LKHQFGASLSSSFVTTKRYRSVRIMFLSAESAYSRPVLRCLISRYRQVAFLNTSASQPIQIHICEIYEHGNQTHKFKLPWSLTAARNRILRVLFSPFYYTTSYLSTLFAIVISIGTIKERIDVLIGDGTHRTFCGVIAKKLGLVRRVVYWASDTLRDLSRPR